MDLDVVLKSHDCPFIVQCLGCFITESDVWICMELMATCFDKLLKRLRKAVPEDILGKVTYAVSCIVTYFWQLHMFCFELNFILIMIFICICDSYITFETRSQKLKELMNNSGKVHCTFQYRYWLDCTYGTSLAGWWGSYYAQYLGCGHTECDCGGWYTGATILQKAAAFMFRASLKMKGWHFLNNWYLGTQLQWS